MDTLVICNDGLSLSWWVHGVHEPKSEREKNGQTGHRRHFKAVRQLYKRRSVQLLKHCTICPPLSATLGSVLCFSQTFQLQSKEITATTCQRNKKSQDGNKFQRLVDYQEFGTDRERVSYREPGADRFRRFQHHLSGG